MIKNKKSLNIRKTSKYARCETIKADTVFKIVMIFAIIQIISSVVSFNQLNVKFDLIDKKFDLIDKKFDKINSKIDNLSIQVINTKDDLYKLYNNKLSSDTISQLMKSIVIVVSDAPIEKNLSSLELVYVDMENNVVGPKCSGFFISCDGKIMTAEHCIDDAKNVYIATLDRNLIPAEVIFSHKNSDVAVLKINVGKTIPVKIGNYKDLRVGSKVSFIGFPLGGIKYELLPITNEGTISYMGFIKRLNGDLEAPTLTINAFVNHGNSGGPVFFSDTGEVVGVMSERMEDNKNQIGIGIASAIEHSQLKYFLVNNYESSCVMEKDN